MGQTGQLLGSQGWRPTAEGERGCLLFCHLLRSFGHSMSAEEEEIDWNLERLEAKSKRRAKDYWVQILRGRLSPARVQGRGLFFCVSFWSLINSSSDFCDLAGVLSHLSTVKVLEVSNQQSERRTEAPHRENDAADRSKARVSPCYTAQCTHS